MAKAHICLCLIIFLYTSSSGSSREVGQLETECFSSDGHSYPPRKSSAICSPRASSLRKSVDVAPNGELLDWPKNDTRRFFHVVYRVGNLDRTIKFYTECFGMKVSRKRDVPKEKYSNAFMSFGPEKSHFSVELTYNYGVSSYDIGDGLGHFAISTQDVYKMVETVRAKGGNVTREPGPVKGGSSIIAFVKDPDGYPFILIQRGPAPEPLCQVMLRVGDLDRAIKFYEKALGMRLLRRIEKPEYKYTIGMMGYDESIVLELTYNYGVTEYKKGNAYAQIAIGTDDVYKSGEVVKMVNKELGGKITREPGPLPGIGTKIVSFLDPDGWKTVLVDNKDFMKELGLTGLGARDSLRLEAGLCLYGNDMEQHISPVEAGLTWAIGKRRRAEGGFLGADMILKQLQDGPTIRRVGFFSSGPPARSHSEVHNENGIKIGETMSGGFSPNLKKNIAMGYVKSGQHKTGTNVKILVRGKPYEGNITKMPD
ncbi:hypothetical protein Bca4012_061561 [Brassica carinata]